MSALFQPSREDGRSDRQVVIDLVHEREPGDVLTHAEVLDALREGTDRVIALRHVYRAVATCSRWLTKHEQLALVPIVGVGYRIALPNDFQGLATTRRDRADSQLVRGRELIEHAPYDKMDVKVRNAMLEIRIVIMGAYSRLNAHDKRIRRLESEIEKLTGQSLEEIEGEAIEEDGEEL